MNLKAIQLDKMYQDALDGLGLSKEYRQLAEEYLNMDNSENLELLEKIELQDLSEIASNNKRKSTTYLAKLKKQKLMEEYARYIRLLVALGGSTARSLIEQEHNCLREELECLTGPNAEAQKAAIYANSYGMFMYSRRTAENMQDLYEIAKQNPQILLNALAFCHENSVYTKILLMAVYLHYVEPKTAPDITDTLVELMINTIPKLFMKGEELKAHEFEKLKAYVKEAKIDTPFPQRLIPIYKHKRTGLTLILLVNCAFLAIEHSERFEIFIRLMLSVNQNMYNVGNNYVLDACMDITDKSWADAHMDQIEEMLPISDEEYIMWCLLRKDDAATKRMSIKYPEGIKAVVPKIKAEDYQYLMSMVQEGNAELYKEMNVSYEKELKGKIADELVAGIYPGREAAKQYLIGECAADALFPYIQEWYKDGSLYWYVKNNYLEKLQKSKDQQLFRRVLVLKAFRSKTYDFENFWLCEVPDTSAPANGSILLDIRQIVGILNILEEEQIPVRYQIGILGGLQDNLEDKKKKPIFKEQCIKVLIEKQQDWGIDAWEAGLFEAAKKGKTTARCLSIQILSYSCDKYKDILLSCAADSSKQVRELVQKICVEHREWEMEIQSMLNSKKKKERELAAMVLEDWEMVSAVEKAEENPVQAGDSVQKALERMAAESLKGTRKRKVEWVYELNLMEVHTSNGIVVSQNYLPAILACYAGMDETGINQEAAKLASALNQEELSDYMCMLLEKWLESGAEAKKRWLLYAISIHGGSKIIPKLYRQVKEWAEHSRGAMAAEAIKALALNGSTEALLLVDQTSRKFKFRQVKNAAALALASAAEALGMSKEELEDKLVPNLGFDRNIERKFDYGTRSFRVLLTPSLEAEVWDEQGKKLKTLPAPAKRDEEEKAKAAYDAFKQMKKQLKTVIENQKLRLEHALRIKRFWQAEKWKELFVENPVMHLFAIGLLWGVYEEGRLKETFRYMEDGSFT